MNVIHGGTYAGNDGGRKDRQLSLNDFPDVIRTIYKAGTQLVKSARQMVRYHTRELAASALHTHRRDGVPSGRLPIRGGGSAHLALV